jgi:predicted nucleotidyltransferase
MSAVPNRNIAERYFPEVKLFSLFRMPHLDSLQRTTIELVSHLASIADLSAGDFGITGSILTDIHNPNFSDVDLIVYGQKNSWKLKTALQRSEELRVQQGASEQYKRRTVERLVRTYGFTLREAAEIYDRRWNYGRYNNRRFSVHPVRKNLEITEKYGDRSFTPHILIEGKAEIIDVAESLFLPSKYKIHRFQTFHGKNLDWIEEVVSYDGLFAGLFDCGECVSIRGKLEEVAHHDGERSFRILVGSPEAQGRDFIKPLT